VLNLIFSMSKLLNILLVDDDEVDIMNMKRAFQKNGITHPLFIANNGEEALWMLKFSDMPKPNVILLDINMPKMNGLEFLSILRQDDYGKDISVFVITSSNEEIDKIKAHQLHVSGYLLKPLTSTEMLNKVDTLNNFWEVCEFP
jgi:CheY-like chemotaxis protein